MNEPTTPAGQPQLPDPPARIHLIGIGGIGVSGLARMLQASGYQISGSDIADSPLVRQLIAEGIAVSIGHRAEQVVGADLVVTTAAAPPDNPELVAAGKLGIPVVKRAAVLGLLSREKRLLAVAGTHGKSTTSGMAAVALSTAGLAPSFAVGADIPALGANASHGAGDFFVAEADEYDYSFLQLDPEVAIVTNIEHDHPDLFPNFRSVLAAFEAFAGRIKPGGTLVACLDDPGGRQLLQAVEPRAAFTIVTYGATVGDWQLHGNNRVTGPDNAALQLRLRVPGRHNQLNAVAVVAAGVALGVEPERLLDGLEQFTGVGRRLEVVFDDDDITIVDDYAHHPTEIRATIQAVRDAYRGRRLLVIFQPHTYSRTKTLLPDFATALGTADEVILVPIYPARETNDLGVNSDQIAEQMTRPVQVARSVDDAAQIAEKRLQPGDVILVAGAGDVYLASQTLAAGREQHDR